MNLQVVDQLTELACMVNEQYDLMVGDMSRAVQRAVRIGDLLSQAKDQVQHGEWEAWVDANLSFGQSMAAKYMRLYRNRERVPDLQATSIREAVALLAEPKDEPTESGDVQTSPRPEADPEIEPELDVAEDKPLGWGELDVYRNDPELEQRLEAATETVQGFQQQLTEVRSELKRKESELAELRKLQADKAKVETALRDLQRLEERKTELFRDAESTKLVHQVLLRSREFFTRECMQIAALHIRPEAVKAMKQDFAGLIELVENWLDAMKERFL